MTRPVRATGGKLRIRFRLIEIATNSRPVSAAAAPRVATKKSVHWSTSYPAALTRQMLSGYVGARRWEPPGATQLPGHRMPDVNHQLRQYTYQQRARSSWSIPASSSCTRGFIGHYQGMTTAQSGLRRIRGRQLRVDIRPGTGNAADSGTPLLLLSGIGVGYEIFDRFVSAADPDVMIIRVDVPGVGGSPVPLLPMAFPQLAAMLVDLLDDLGHRAVDVLGFSWGGALAQQFAVQFPTRCRRLILLSTSAGLLSIPGEPRILGKMLAPMDFRDARAGAGMMYGKDPDAHIDDVRDLFRNSAANASGLGYLYQLAAVAYWTSVFFLPLIRQPTLVMGGDSDPLVPAANARILAGLIPNATLLVFTGGHIEPLADPCIVSAQIGRFLG